MKLNWPLLAAVVLGWQIPSPARADGERLRGAMIGRVNAEDLRTLAKEWGANHVRWQLTWDGFPQSKADTASPQDYDAWLQSELNRLDSLLPVCEESGLKVLIDLHTGPGGRDKENVCRIFQEARFQEQFLRIWESIARRYRNARGVWGYDLINEPLEPKSQPAGLLGWQELAEKAAKRVREIDRRKPIIVEPAPWGGVESLANLKPIPVSNVVYSVHMYLPFKFTHQGVYNDPVGVSYPGEVDGKRWDKAQIRRVFMPVVEFQKKNRVPIYVGEFSAIRWAPGAAQYLGDLIDVLEENGWSWAYHAYREWDGWSVEHDGPKGDASRAAKQTEREKLLRAYFARNGSS